LIVSLGGPQGVRDLLVALATGHQAHHLRFAFGQRLARRLGVNVGARARARFSAWRDDVAWQRAFVIVIGRNSVASRKKTLSPVVGERAVIAGTWLSRRGRRREVPS
jgi:hypothetical protein